MNLLEYVQSLGSDISLEEKIALTKDWKEKNEPVEKVVEEVKIDPVVETDATASGKTKPVSNEEFMKSISGGGIFDSLENTTLSQRLNAIPETNKDNPLLDPVESDFDIKDLQNKTFFQKVGLEPVFSLPDSYKTKADVGQTYNPRGKYDYKYEINKKTGSIDYYAKAVDSEDYKLQTDTYAIAKVADVFDHLNEKQSKSLKLYDKQLSGQKKEKRTINSLPTFDEFKNTESDSNEFSYIKSIPGLSNSTGDMALKDVFAKISEIDEIIADFTVTEIVEEPSIFLNNPSTYKEEKSLDIKTKEGEAYFKKLLAIRKKLSKDASYELGLNPAYNTADRDEATKIASQMSYLGALFNNLREGSTTLGQHMASIPETLYDIAATPQNALAAATGWDIGVTSEEFKEELGIKNYILDYYIEEQEKLGLINKEFGVQNFENQGISDSFNTGNYMDGFKLIGLGLANSAPVSMSMMIGGAYMKTAQYLAAGTIGFAGKEIREMRDEHPAMSEFEIMTKSLGIAGAETIFGLIGKGTIGKSYRTIIAREGKEEGAKIFKKGIIEMYETALRKYGAAAGIVGEGIEEVATQITQNMIKGLDPMQGVPDAFILGMSGGGLYSSPTNIMQARNFVKNGIANRKVDNVLLKYGLNNLNEAFNTETLTTEGEIDILNVKNSLQVIDSRINKQVKAGTITEAQGNSIKQRARDVQNSSTALSRIDVSQENQSSFIDLMIEQKTLKNKIKEVDNPSLTKVESARLNEIDTTLSELVIASRTQKIEGEIETIEKFAPEGSVFSYDTTKEFVEATKADADADAFIAKDGKIYINKQRAAEVGAITAASHERLHQILRSTFANPENALKLVENFKKILSKKEIAIIQKRIDENYADASPLKQAEEYLTAFSDAIGKGELTWADNLTETFMMLAKPILDIFRAKGYGKLEFRTGRDVYEFIKDYQKNIQQGTQSARAEALSTQSEGITTSETQESKTTNVDNLAGKYKTDPNSLSANETQNLKEQYTKLGIDALKQWSGKRNVPINNLLSNPDTFKSIESDVLNQFPSIMKNYTPINKATGQPQKLSTYIGNILGRRVGPKLVEDYTKALNTKSISNENQKELENIKAGSSASITEIDTDVKLVDNIKINKQPLSVEFKDKVRGFVTKQLEGLDPKSEKFRKQAFKPSKAFVDLIAKDIIGSPKKFREFLNENPTFYKGLNITELIAIDDGRVKKGQPRLFTEVNRRLTKQKDIEKFMMQGRVPYLTTTQQKAGANLYNRLTPKIAAVVNNFFGSTPQNNSNRKRAIAKAIANKFISEAAPSTEAFKAKPQDVRAKTAEKLQVSQNAKFSKTVENTFQKLGLDEDADFTPDFRDYNYDYTKTLNKLLDGIKDSEGNPIKRIDMKTDAGRKRFLDFAISSGLTRKLPPMFWRKLGFTSENLLRDKTKKYEEGVKKTKADIDALIEDGAIFDKRDFRGYKGNLPFRSVIEANEWISESIDAEKQRLMKPENEGGENLSKAKATLKAKTLFAKDSDFPAMKTMLTYENVYSIKGNLENELNNPEFVTRQDESIDQLGKLFEMFQNDIMKDVDGNVNYEGVAFVGALLSSSSSGQGHFLRSAAPFRFYQKGYMDTGSSGNTLEHTLPATIVGKYLFKKALDGTVKDSFKNVKKNYFQGPLSVSNDNKLKGTKLNGEAFDYVEQTPENWNMSDNIWARYFNINVGLNAGGINPSDLILAGGKSVYDVHNITSTGVKVDSYSKSSRAKANDLDSDLVPDAIAYDKPVTTQTLINALAKTDEALHKARRLNPRIKKIRVFDFDDTLATSKSMVIVNMPNGSSKKINATQFAKQAADLEANGAKFDFTEFSKVVKGKKGPLFSVAQKIADARGTEDVFILTARPQEAAGPIRAFMKANGIDIPLKNITGLSDGTPQAKAGWIMGKAAEGYNDFYFADDAVKNVKAVEDVLSQVDVKSEVQVAKFSKTKTFDTIVNDMIEDSSGIETYKEYSSARAKTVGANKGRFNFFIPNSAEDFTGLLYKMLGKGKKGDAQMAFLKTNLLDPYDKAESAVTQAKIAAANDFKALKTQLKTLPKSLSVPTGIGGFTYSHAVRVAVWTAQGMNIPGLSKRDIKELNDFVNSNNELKTFANELIVIQKNKPYPKPGDNWLGGNITSDIINDINKVNRAEYQQEWRENVDIIFSEANMNKMEAAYGTRWREAMEDSLRRMKSGSNRPPGGNRVTDGLLDWLNNSVGAVMFLNTRSALLQTISSVNFINWGDNNIVKAGLAFANQKQFWSDFMSLMNSDYLVERRNGLKINVSESEIADAVKDSKNKVKSAIALLLSKGFVMTRFADSFAIATGGATFYRNRVKALIAKGMEQKAAEAQAFEDFRQIAEESQQSSNPNRISAQQASGAGRVILAWANTPMQYARIQKRSAQDLINGRGDWKTNVSKIVYYGAIQNLIFNALQQAVFALGFGEDEEEKEAKKNEKVYRIANGMIDSQLKGLGIGGAAVVALKTALMELGKQYAKDRPKYEEATFDLLGFSPPLGSKIQKINSGFRSFSWNMKDMKEKGFSLDNPAYLAGAQITTGLTNVPLDRLIKKINNVRGIVNEQSALWQKVALGLGWSTWDVGLGYYGGFDAAKVLTADEEKAKEIDTMKKLTKTKEQVDMLLDLGLTKKEIKALGKEQARVEKIIELQNAEEKPKEEIKVKEEIKEETKPKPKPKVKTKPKNESSERKLRRQFDSIKGENKPEQVKSLLGFGLSKKEVRALKYEKDRVEKILELMNK